MVENVGGMLLLSKESLNRCDTPGELLTDLYLYLYNYLTIFIESTFSSETRLFVGVVQVRF